MTPYYEDATTTIYHGDCLAVLQRLGKATVDCVLTDPPYGSSFVSNRRNSRFAGIVGDHEVPTEWVLHGARVCKVGASLFWFVDETGIGPAQTALHNAFFKLQRLIVWDKGVVTAGNLEGFGSQTEFIVFGGYSQGHRKTNHRTNGPRSGNILSIPRVDGRRLVHPAEKPIHLLALLIARSTNYDEVVLDPFMGSGSTLRAAKDLGRKAIGIEIEERYCEIAAQRLAQEVLAL